MKYKMKVRVNTRLRIRTGPGLSFSFSKTEYLYDGDIIIATDQSNGWYKHDKGWSSGEFLIFIEDLEQDSPISTSPVEVPNAPINNTNPTKPNIFTPKTNISENKYSYKPITNNTSYKTDDLVDSLRSQGWYDESEIEHNKLYKLNRFGYKETTGIRTTREYLFFTKPDLNIYQDSDGNNLNEYFDNDPLMNEIHYRFPEVLYQLQSSVTVDKSPFMNLLYNSVKNKLDLPTITSKEIETSSTQFGTKMFYRKHSFESDENHEFSLEFEDSKNIKLYYLFRAWDKYNNMKSIGLVAPKDEYRDNRELHDQISIYKVIVDETNSNILFFAKLTGVFPKGAPREVFSDITDELVYSIPFKAHFIEDLNPIIIEEFNRLTINQTGNDLPLYDTNKRRPIGRWATSAYIEKYNYGESYAYRLKWRE